MQPVSFAFSCVALVVALYTYLVLVRRIRTQKLIIDMLERERERLMKLAATSPRRINSVEMQPWFCDSCGKMWFEGNVCSCGAKKVTV